MNQPNNFEPNAIIDSVLCVRASGSINDDIINDLCLDNGKSIAELLHDQKENQNK